MDPRAKAKEYLVRKGIPDPEVVAAHLDAIGLDKIERLANGDITDSTKNYFVEHFTSFTKRNPLWTQLKDHDEYSLGERRKLPNDDGNEIVNLFWSQFSSEQIERIMVIRKQNSGLCYLHAPIVLEHYLIAIATGCQCSSTYNIGKYYENYLLTENKMVDFLLKEVGGSSEKTLRELCNLKDTDTETINIPSKKRFSKSHDEICKYVLDTVAEKPALISSFKVYKDFLSPDAETFSDTTYCESQLGLHSMVLIGARKSSDGKYFFLLQNWWEGKFFIEVSGEYISHCNAEIIFVNIPITRKAELADFLSEALYAETSVDSPEIFFEQK